MKLVCIFVFSMAMLNTHFCSAWFSRSETETVEERNRKYDEMMEEKLRSFERYTVITADGIREVVNVDYEDREDPADHDSVDHEA